MAWARQKRARFCLRLEILALIIVVVFLFKQPNSGACRKLHSKGAGRPMADDELVDKIKPVWWILLSLQARA